MQKQTSEWKQNTEFMDKNLSSFIDSVIEQKKLQFVDSEISFDISLFENGILNIENKNMSITNFELVASPFLKIYEKKFEFQITKEFIKNVDFVQKINKDFLSNGYVHNYHNLEKEIWKIVIKESNANYQCSFSTYLKSIDIENKPKEVFQFIDAYSSVLPELQLSSNSIVENSIILMEITKSDADYNMPLGSVLNGIKNKCKSDYNLGLDLLQRFLIVEEDKENIISATVTGLYENKRKNFYDSTLKDLIAKGSKLNPIFFGLSNISEIDDSECELFIELINIFKNDDSLIISILSLVISTLTSSNIKYHSFCLKELESAIEKEKTAYYILNKLDRIDNYHKEKTEIIIKHINQTYFSIEKYINPISNVFWHLKDFVSFKKVVLAIIEKKPFEKFVESFHSYFHSADGIELDKFTIELLIDNRASVRFIGINLFDSLSNNIPYSFSYEILKLPYISQYKLWVSLIQDLHQPKDRLVALLPLLNSKSDPIKESFICKLEEISEDFGGHVTKVLEEHLDKSVNENKLIIDRIRIYIERFYSKKVDIKHLIAELNPYHTHYKHIRLFDELLQKKMNESIDKGARENSLLSILGTNTVQLSKGGGWRFGNKKEISQLGKVGTSFTLPRSYFINPDKFELEKGFLLKKDWIDSEFIDIKAILDNE